VAIILNIETSGLYCSVSLSHNGETLSEISEQEINRHASQLTILIDKCLKNAHVPMHKLEAIAICDGPGSYTGLRIGASAAKGLCYTLNIPLIAISAFDVMVNSCNFSKNSENIIPIIQARKDAFYYSIYNADKKCIMEPKTCLISNIADEFKMMSEKPYAIFSKLNKDILETLNIFASTFDIYPINAGQMSFLSHKNYETATFREIITYEPRYLSGFGKQF
jgi:tRNA threonylcarbamoyladenosine biosynthesis protein TsaB